MNKKPKGTKKSNIQKWVLVPDVHCPYHNEKAVDLMLRAAKGAGYTNACILGDFPDFYSVSDHDKDPNRRADLQWEVEETNKLLDKFDKVFTGEKRYIAGNHEDRLTRYLMKHAKELFNMYSIPALFDLANRGWLYTPYKAHAYIGKLAVTHDVGKAGRYAHYDAGAAFQGNVTIGHLHRMGYAVEGNAVGKPHVFASFGWLGDVEQVDYMKKIKALRDWATGFGTCHLDVNSGEVFLTPCPIVNGRVLVDGQLYS